MTEATRSTFYLAFDKLGFGKLVLFNEADAAVARALDLMGRAPRGKDGVMALASIREDMDLVATSVEAARVAQTAGRIFEARDRAQSALNQANEIIAELNAAIGAVAPRPRA